MPCVVGCSAWTDLSDLEWTEIRQKQLSASIPRLITMWSHVQSSCHDSETYRHPSLSTLDIAHLTHATNLLQIRMQLVLGPFSNRHLATDSGPCWKPKTRADCCMTKAWTIVQPCPYCLPNRKVLFHEAGRAPPADGSTLHKVISYRPSYLTTLVS